jgi:hypothetical protein
MATQATEPLAASKVTPAQDHSIVMIKKRRLRRSFWLRGNLEDHKGIV